MKKILFSVLLLIGLVMLLPQNGVAQAGKSALKGGLESKNFSSAPTNMDFKVVANTLGLGVEDVMFLHYSGAIGISHGLDGRPTVVLDNMGAVIQALIDCGQVNFAGQEIYCHGDLNN